MGWMNEQERRQTKKLFGQVAVYRCDADDCQRPIFTGDIPVIDPKGGYFPKPVGLPNFLPREPKRTYHRACDKALRETSKKKSKGE